jgi:mercuric ion transport protein
MKQGIKLPIIGAVLTAFLSTLCCVPAFLFLFFGLSSGALSFLTQLDFLRIPLGILALLFFILAVIKLNQTLTCECNKEKRVKSFIGYGIIFMGIMGLLFYPEIIPLFME